MLESWDINLARAKKASERGRRTGFILVSEKRKTSCPESLRFFLPVTLKPLSMRLILQEQCVWHRPSEPVVRDRSHAFIYTLKLTSDPTCQVSSAACTVVYCKSAPDRLSRQRIVTRLTILPDFYQDFLSAFSSKEKKERKKVISLFSPSYILSCSFIPNHCRVNHSNEQDVYSILTLLAPLTLNSGAHRFMSLKAPQFNSQSTRTHRVHFKFPHLIEKCLVLIHDHFHSNSSFTGACMANTSHKRIKNLIPVSWCLDFSYNEVLWGSR